MNEQKPEQYLTQVTIPALPGAIAILSEAWSVYKKRMKTFLGIMLIPSVAMILLSIPWIAVSLLGISSITELFLGLFSFWIILLILVGIILQLWGYLALIYAIKDSQENIGIKESYRRSRSQITSYLWIFTLSGLIVLGGFFLLIVPGIIFAVWFSFAVFLLIDENLRGMDALLKSREYIRGKWGSVFWRLLFMGIIFLTICFILMIIFHSLSGILTPILSFLLSPLIMTYYFLVYKKVKALKGEFVFTPTRKKKLPFIFIGILGIILLISIIFSSLSFPN